MTIRLLLGSCFGAVLLAGSFSREADGQAEARRDLYSECAACHALDRNEFGPRMCGIFGRKAGSVADFPYSEAMKKLDLTWTETSLDEFLKSPADRVPGTSMNFRGIQDDKVRADLIAHMKVITDPGKCQ
jgi:cytochrome c